MTLVSGQHVGALLGTVLKLEKMSKSIYYLENGGSYNDWFMVSVICRTSLSHMCSFSRSYRLWGFAPNNYTQISTCMPLFFFFTFLIFFKVEKNWWQEFVARTRTFLTDSTLACMLNCTSEPVGRPQISPSGLYSVSSLFTLWSTSVSSWLTCPQAAAHTQL